MVLVLDTSQMLSNLEGKKKGRKEGQWGEGMRQIKPYFSKSWKLSILTQWGLWSCQPIPFLPPFP